VAGDFDAIAKTLLVEYVADMVLHGADADSELGGDLLDGESARHRRDEETEHGEEERSDPPPNKSASVRSRRVRSPAV
jgi:hypothetical protein